MDCEFAEKVSMMIDAELSESESRQIGKHIEVCDECRDLKKDFLFFREQIKESAQDVAREKSRLPIFSTGNRFAFWKNKILSPVPAVVAALILFAASLGIWLIASKAGRPEKTVADNDAGNAPAKAENAPNEISIARFDKGGRAEIYVAPRETKRVEK